MCFDAKVNFDDNAEFRQKAIHAMHDTTESDPREVDAAENGLNYISMEGNIACLGNQFQYIICIGRHLNLYTNIKNRK